MIWKIIKFIPLTLFLLLVIFLYKGLYSDKNNIGSAMIGKQFPVFSLPSLDDKFIVKETYIKGPALVNVWATWCPNCFAEHTFLNTLAMKGVAIYGINYKDEREEALHWLSEMKNPYNLNIFDKEGKLGLDLGVFGAPETFVIDKNGVIVSKHIGEVDEKVWKEKLEPIYYSLEK